MKHLITIVMVVIALIIGYTAGMDSKEIVDVTAADAGIQITYEDGTGYWYEY